MPVAFKPRHAIPRNELIKESRNWLDLYLGPINWTQQTDFLGNSKIGQKQAPAKLLRTSRRVFTNAFLSCGRITPNASSWKLRSEGRAGDYTVMWSPGRQLHDIGDGEDLSDFDEW